MRKVTITDKNGKVYKNLVVIFNRVFPTAIRMADRYGKQTVEYHGEHMTITPIKQASPE